MSQQSQFSEGGFSDILSDVDNFIQEEGMIEDVGHLLTGLPNGNVTDEEEDFKPSPAVKSFAVPNDPPPYPNLYETRHPPDQPQNLGTEEYSGPFDFEVLIIPSEQKTPWEYSLKLNKIFIGINLKFPVAFSVKNRPHNVKLYIRATPIFTQSQFFQEIVHRCVGHQHPQDNSNKGVSPHIFQHIIRCTNDNTRYFGDKNINTRLNLVVPLGQPQAGSDLIKEFFHFVCKNSCPLGMNRRPIDIVFSLENEHGELFGRKLVSVRVCSCPKRDREKEEKDLNSSNPPKQGKKRKLAGAPNGNKENGESAYDVKTYNLNINVPGFKNYLHLLNSARDRMASEILKLEGRGTSNHPFRRSYNELSVLINQANE